MQEQESHPQRVEIRPWNESDDVQEITDVLHRAYAQLADLGFRFHATWQDAATTLNRLSKGVPFIAEDGGRIVGTITLYLPPNDSKCVWYQRDDVASFGQFGVEPEWQGRGIGSKLLSAVEAEAKARGIPNLALDTAEGAQHLIEMYQRRGFETVGCVDWEITNYRSVIMNKELRS